MLPKLKQLLLELSNLPLVEHTSSSSFKPVLHFIDDCLLTIKENLELTNFELLLGKFWMAVIEEINGQVDSGLEVKILLFVYLQHAILSINSFHSYSFRI